jgi:hypothetical protein
MQRQTAGPQLILVGGGRLAVDVLQQQQRLEAVPGGGAHRGEV